VSEKNAFKLNWRQAVSDVLLIVIGVSIALAADSWLGNRIEKARTEQLLDALEDEWTTEFERISTHLDVLNQGKAAVARIIKAHDDGPENLSIKDASVLMEGFRWSTFKPSDGALNTLMADGIQNIDDKALRLAVASWRTVLAEVTAEQAALRELGTLKQRSIETRIVQNSAERFSGEAVEYNFWTYGMEPGAFYLAVIADDEWVANLRHLVNLLHDYHVQLSDIQNILERNLTLLQERAKI